MADQIRTMKYRASQTISLWYLPEEAVFLGSLFILSSGYLCLAVAASRGPQLEIVKAVIHPDMNSPCLPEYWAREENESFLSAVLRCHCYCG